MEAALFVIAAVVVLAGLSMEMKLGRANRIARATHDLMKALLDETKKTNAMLQYLNDREYEKAKKIGENAECRTPNAQSRMEEKKPEPTVYNIY